LIGELAWPVVELVPRGSLVAAATGVLAEPSVAERAVVASIPLAEPVTVTVVAAVAVAVAVAAAAAPSIPAAVLPTRPAMTIEPLSCPDKKAYAPA
jgi:hypothetical protein